MAYVFIIPGGVYPGLKAVSSDTAFFLYAGSRFVILYMAKVSRYAKLDKRTDGRI